MQKNRRKKLASEGWRVGTANDFLGLSPEQVTITELKHALGNATKENRKKEKLTQVAFAKVIHSSQSRVAKIEAGNPSVSIDLLVKSMLALGAPWRDLANAIAAPRP